MSKVLELQQMLTDSRDSLAEQLINMWVTWNTQRNEWVSSKTELRNYIFATDTSTTTNSSLPWKNKTTLPKLCQIRDNLHSNYISALFPNERWLRWEGKSLEDEQKRKTIETYMYNVVDESGFRLVMSQLLLDYIDYGNCFCTVDFVTERSTDLTGGYVVDYAGPVVRRIAPTDITFNPTAPDFAHSPKYIRSIISEGEFKQMVQDNPDNSALAELALRRDDFKNKVGIYTKEDFLKAEGFSMDGFGSYYEYLKSPQVEIITFYGDYNDAQSGTFKRKRKVTIVDRMFVLEDVEQEHTFSTAPIFPVSSAPR